MALAALLVSAHDLLVLDEPTNHLDVEAVAWLAEHLGGRSPAPTRLVVVTHDRWFLDAVCDPDLGGHQRRGATPYEGGYAAYVLAKAERERQAAVVAERRDRTCSARSSPGCGAVRRRGRRKPKFRIDAANALIEDEPPPRDRRAAAVRRPAARQGRHRPRGRRPGARRPGAPRPPPGGSGRATGSGSSASTVPARRRCCARWRARLALAAGTRKVGRDGRDRATSPRSCASSTRWAGLPGHRGGRGCPLGRASGGEELSASQLAQRFGFTGAAADRGSATCPAGSAGGSS